MKKKQIILMILFAVLAATLLLFFLFSGNGEKRYRWHEGYQAESDQPYGTLFLRKMLEGHYPGRFVYNNKTSLNELLDTATENTSYVFIGQSLFLTEEDANALTRFLDAGGNAFIASLELPEAIINNVYFKECGTALKLQYNENDTVNLNFYHPALNRKEGFKYAFRFGSKDWPYPWSYIHDSVFCDSTKSIVPLGYHGDNFVNFIKIRAGKGNLFLHSNPLIFTNYFLTKPDKVDYASAVFSHLQGDNVIWDEYSKVPFARNNNAYNSPLYYILQQPSLKYAWWLLLLTTALYIFFAAKRQQRAIPVLETKTNSSLEYVNLIATLHYRNGNHADMARKKMRYFLYFVRSRYGIHAETFQTEHIKKLSEKAKVPLADVENIFSQYYLIDKKFRDTIEANRLLNLYSAIENFYNHCK